MRKLFFLVCLVFFTFVNSASAVQTAYGKIVGIETRPWGFHVQTDFAFPGAENINCSCNVGAVYMYDFYIDNSTNSPGASMEISTLLTAFAAGKDVAFHIYGCASGNTRPVIGYILVK